MSADGSPDPGRHLIFGGGVAANGVEPVPTFQDFAPSVSGMQDGLHNTVTKPNLATSRFDMFMTTTDLNNTLTLENNLMFDIDTFLANMDPSQFSFTDSSSILAESSSDFSRTDLNIGGGVQPESEVDTDELEYIGPPATYCPGPIAAPQSAVDEGHPGMASAVGDIDGTLPRLPPPPPLSPPSIEPGELSADAPAAESGNTAAARHIDLELNERNIISGKRKRTASTRAAASAVSSRPPKKVLPAR
ncbi:hypothetical protein B0H14DRAFT_2770030 [Mycena olivaceomarginata]|nr:hypothetical protein B0H14DRAFT_2770030 [Mycena olivaceomarginata]